MKSSVNDNRAKARFRLTGNNGRRIADSLSLSLSRTFPRKSFSPPLHLSILFAPLFTVPFWKFHGHWVWHPGFVVRSAQLSSCMILRVKTTKMKSADNGWWIVWWIYSGRILLGGLKILWMNIQIREKCRGIKIWEFLAKEKIGGAYSEFLLVWIVYNFFPPSLISRIKDFLKQKYITFKNLCDLEISQVLIFFHIHLFVIH